MRLIDSDRLLTDKMKSKYYHLQNGDIAIPIIDIEHAPTVEAIPVTEKAFEMFETDYENRLKADLEAMLEDLKKEVNELYIDCPMAEYDEDMNRGIEMAADVIQQKINELKGNEDATN